VCRFEFVIVSFFSFSEKVSAFWITSKNLRSKPFVSSSQNIIVEIGAENLTLPSVIEKSAP